MKKRILFSAAILSLLALIAVDCSLVLADEGNTNTSEETEAVAQELGATETALNNANSDQTQTVETTGTLIEIGNTTADSTTVIVRTTEGSATTDQTVQVNLTGTNATTLTNNENGKSDLSDWIAGDNLNLTVTKNKNSGEITAKKIRNRAFRNFQKGKNGWITAIRADESKCTGEIDVKWANNIFTLKINDKTKMVAGLKNPACLNDFKVGDRVRSRVEEDGDQNPATWNAKIIVVLRRGNALFMRVTRVIVPAEIVELPEDTTATTTTITVKILDNKFYQKGDVNNLIGKPGDSLIVDINNKTKLVRRFWGKCLLGEFIEGDKVMIVGRLDDATGHLTANLIKNESIQRLGVVRHLGTVTSVDTTTMKIKANLLVSKKEYTIQLTNKTKIIRRGSGAITLADVKVGDIIRVRGTLNRRLKQVTADTVVVWTKTTKEQACTNAGGTVKTVTCCKSTSDFPNLCLIGACGCSAENSHEIKTCDCGEGKCFDGVKCVSS